MEDFDFNVEDILTGDEAEQLIGQLEQPQEEQEESSPEKEKEEKEEIKPAEEEVQEPSPEGVGEEEKEDGNAITHEEDGSSPNIYSSIAKALVNDGIFSGLEDKDLEGVKSPEDFAELFEKVIASRTSDETRRVTELLRNGVAPDTVRQYESTLEWLGSVDEDALNAEGEEGDNLRRYLIYNDLINRGYDEDKAKEKVERSFKANTEKEDAKDALEALTAHFQNDYKRVQEEAKNAAEVRKQTQKKQIEDFRKMVLEDDMTLGETKLDKRTAQKVYDAVMKPTYKDPKTGKLLTAVQQFQMEKPLEFLKQLGMWFVLTDGGKIMDGFTKEQLRKEKNKSIREMAAKINSSSLNLDGSLRYASAPSKDTLLSGDWEPM